MDELTYREEGFERAFSHEEEMRFKARVRRNRLLGEWAGEKLGLSGVALTEYAAALAARAVEAESDEALVAELAARLQPLGLSDHRIRRRLEEFTAQATIAIQAGR